MALLSSYLLNLFSKEKEISKIYIEEFVITISDSNYSDSFEELKNTLRLKIADKYKYSDYSEGDAIYQHLKRQVEQYAESLFSDKKGSYRRNEEKTSFVKTIKNIEIQNFEMRQGSLQLVFTVIMSTLEIYSTLSELINSRDREADMQFDLMAGSILNEMRYVLGNQYNVNQYHRPIKRQSDSDNLLPVLINQIQKGNGSNKFQPFLILALAASLGLNTYFIEDVNHLNHDRHYQEQPYTEHSTRDNDADVKIYLNGKEDVKIGEFNEHTDKERKSEVEQPRDHIDPTDSIEIILRRHHQGSH